MGGPESRARLEQGPGFRVPDTSYWAAGRPSGGDSLPTLAVAVRSPGQAIAELREKCRRFREADVEACWLLDPESRAVELFEGTEHGRTLPADGRLEAKALPGLSIPIAELFAVLDR